MSQDIRAVTYYFDVLIINKNHTAAIFFKKQPFQMYSRSVQPNTAKEYKPVCIRTGMTSHPVLPMLQPSGPATRDVVCRYSSP